MLEETRLWIQPGFLYHTDKAVKDFNILMTLTIYDRAFPNLNVVNQFLNDFPVKLLQIQIAADGVCPLMDVFNFLLDFPFLCQKCIQTVSFLDALLFAFLDQNREGIAMDGTADLILIEFGGHVFQFSDAPPQSADFLFGIFLLGRAFG